jgi:hypothetical protein
MFSRFVKIIFLALLTGCSTYDINQSRITASTVTGYANTFAGSNAVSQGLLDYQYAARTGVGIWQSPLDFLVTLPQYYLY